MLSILCLSTHFTAQGCRCLRCAKTNRLERGLGVQLLRTRGLKRRVICTKRDIFNYILRRLYFDYLLASMLQLRKKFDDLASCLVEPDFLPTPSLRSWFGAWCTGHCIRYIVQPGRGLCGTPSKFYSADCSFHIPPWPARGATRRPHRQARIPGAAAVGCCWPASEWARCLQCDFQPPQPP